MSCIRHTAVAAFCVVLSSAVWAADPVDHKAHHPDATASSTSAKAAPAGNAAKKSMADMDAQMKVMREMHEKMMSAKTAEERQALMAEHMKVMHDGMAMMGGMSMPMMGGAGKGGMKGHMSGDMMMCHQMMEKRMAMMEGMMQMMMDQMMESEKK